MNLAVTQMDSVTQQNAALVEEAAAAAASLEEQTRQLKDVVSQAYRWIGGGCACESACAGGACRAGGIGEKTCGEHHESFAGA